MKRSRTGITDASQNKDDNDDNDDRSSSSSQEKTLSAQDSPVLPRNGNIPKWQDALAGASAGAFSKTAMAPVERVKLLMQLQGSVVPVPVPNPNGTAAATATSAAVSGGPWRVAMHIYESEGLFAFWRGNWPNVLRTAGQAALNFSFMDYYKSSLAGMLSRLPAVAGATTTTMEELDRQRHLVVSFVSGGLAGATSTTALYPTEFLRTRLAMDQGRCSETREYRSMRDCLIKTIRSDGIWGVYQGYGIALWGSVLYRLLYLGGYDVIKNELLLSRDDDNDDGHGRRRPLQPKRESIPLGEKFMIAQGVSLVAGTICYPIDSVRRRLMMQAGKTKEQRLYQGSLHCFQQVWSKEGLRGFYLGLTPNLVRSVGGAIMLVAYDAMKTVM